MNTPLLLNANSLHIPLASQSVQMVATSPPYYSLRDYGVEGQIGQETTPAAYVENLVNVFREVWRVLKADGVLWLNLGDSYNGSGGAGGDYAPGGLKDGQPKYKGARVDGLKPKDLIGIPWRVAFALQADGWYLRSDVIWSKPNPMPESVTDRPTKAHEYVFLLSKSQKYFYDADAIKEKAVEGNDLGLLRGKQAGGADANLVAWHAHSIKARQDKGIDSRSGNPSGLKNKRSVWEVATSPYSGAHFATWPPALVEPMIKAGSRRGDIVLDPFAGSGTTLMVARQLGRRAVGLDLSYTYLRECARPRLGLEQLDNWKNGIPAKTQFHDLPLFA